MAQVFTVRPAGSKKDPSGRKIDFERVQKELIGPVLELAQIGAASSGELVDGGYVREEITAALIAADLVICDITLQDANVFYALGVRQALRRRRTILIKGQPTDDSNPFEQLSIPQVLYDVGSPGAARERLLAAVQLAVRADALADSPIFQMAAELPEPDPERLQLVPADFGAEVERACANKAVGWLQLLASEVSGRRFQLPARLQLARAQLELGDWSGARSSWEALRDAMPEHLEANLALGYLYTRLYQRDRRAELLELSDQALARLIKNDRASRLQRVNALHLAGENQQARWRLLLSDLGEVTQRRAVAMNRALLRSYEYFLDAYFDDLNQYRSGLTALQTGTLLLELAGEESWFDAFDSDSAAETYKRRLDAQMHSLRQMVPVSLDTVLRRMREDDPERLRAEVSAADVLFLTTEGRDQRVVSAYLHAVPPDKPNTWHMARQQLELFLSLGVRGELAGKVIAAVEPRFAAGSASADPVLATRSRHAQQVVLLATSGGDASRVQFGGLGTEAQVRSLLVDLFEQLAGTAERVLLYATANSGVDILAHEVAADLGITHYVCLPENQDDFVARNWAGLTDWSARFERLGNSSRVLELNTELGLPRWLQGSSVDPARRYANWLLNLATAHAAEATTLLVIDEVRTGARQDLDIGQLQILAREYGAIDIVQIGNATNSKQIA